MSFNIRLKQFRKKIHLNQKEMAAKLSISLMTYQRYEKGSHLPDVEKIKLINVLGADIQWLITGKQEDSQDEPSTSIRPHRMLLSLSDELHTLLRSFTQETGIPSATFVTALLECSRIDLINIITATKNAKKNFGLTLQTFQFHYENQHF